MVLVILVILALLEIPALIHPYEGSKITHCMNNLKQIGLAEQLWMDDNTNDFSCRVSTNQQGTMEYLEQGRVDLHFKSLSYLYPQPQVLHCPTDTRKAITKFAELKNTNISYFVSLSATTENPASIVAGDCNFEINGRLTHSGTATWAATDTIGWAPGLHSRESNALGNVLFADGHIEMLRQTSLPALGQKLGTNTARLSFP